MGDLPRLKTLSLDGCTALGSLPPKLGQLRLLEALSLNDCSSLAAIPTLAGMVCDPSGMWAAQLPGLGSLTSLRLQHLKHITTLPPSIASCEALVALSLGGCLALQSLPKEMGSLQKLEVLEMWRCIAVTSLPTELGGLLRLRLLNLRNCEALTGLPSSFEGLNALESLNIAFCTRIQEMPNLSSLPLLSSVITVGVDNADIKVWYQDWAAARNAKTAEAAEEGRSQEWHPRWEVLGSSGWIPYQPSVAWEIEKAANAGVDSITVKVTHGMGSPASDRGRSWMYTIRRDYNPMAETSHYQISHQTAGTKRRVRRHGRSLGESEVR